MRTEREIIELIINVAKEDYRIRSVVMTGSRANPNCQKDEFQDYDILYTVTDIKPFYNNMSWIEEKFGKPIIMQLPEIMTYPGLLPDKDGHFTYLMIFDDDVRIDLSVDFKEFKHTGEPVLVLLDKDNTLKKPDIDPYFFAVKPPVKEWFSDVCNEFWWCLNNVARGIGREELSYAFDIYNTTIRAMLNQMIRWYVGISYNFSVSTGKRNKHFKKYLSETEYGKYLSTYADGKNLLNAVFSACDMFHDCAVKVAEYLDVEYNMGEEINMRSYIKRVCFKEKKI